MSLRNRVREYRLAAGESLADLAQAVGTDRSQITRIERDIRGCPDWLKVRLADHYQVSVTDLFFVPSNGAPLPPVKSTG